MQEVIEQYGAGLLSVLSVLAVFGILMTLFGNGGILSGIVADYMNYLGGA